MKLPLQLWFIKDEQERLLEISLEVNRKVTLRV